ncbi:MAG: hypothetical protein R3B09_30190 [Nannocystaceae bacterium]
MRAGIGGLVLALGAPDGAGLMWDAPAVGCPSEAALRARLDALLGPRTLTVDARARVRAIDDRYRLELQTRWRGAVDEQVIEADACDDLAEAAALLVAMLAERDEAASADDLDEGAPEREVEIASESEIEATPAEAELAAPAPATRRGLPRGLSFTALGVVDRGSLPGIAGGLALQFEVRWPRLRVFAGGLYLPPRAVPDAPSYAVGGRAQLGLARVGTCVRLGDRRIEAPLCGALEVGGSAAAGFGIAGDRGAHDPWVALAFAPALVVPVARHVALRAGVDVVVPLLLSRYVYGGDLLHETAPVVVRGGLGLEFQFSSEILGLPENR